MNRKEIAYLLKKGFSMQEIMSLDVEEPVPEPIPEPVPEPVPEPIPEPVPEPVPEPKPEPINPNKTPIKMSTFEEEIDKILNEM